MKISALRLVVVLFAAHPVGTAFAADLNSTPPPPPVFPPARAYDIVMEVGLGGAFKPAYEGAKDYELTPTGFVTLHQLWLPVFGSIKDGQRKTEGWSFGPSFRYLSSRDSADHSELRGLNDVDASFEVGAKVAYTFGWLRPSLALRHGFGGHDGIVGEAALDALFYPTPMIELTVGQRASFASASYMSTYFDVTPRESARSGLRAYNAGGGFKGFGAEITGKYRFTDQWAVGGSLAY